MKVLVLEDCPSRTREFRQRFLERGWEGRFESRADHAIDALETEIFSLIFLDHDLGDEIYVNTDERNTGSEVARWINEHPVLCPVVIHSLNGSAAEHMKTLISGAIRLPYVWSEERFNTHFPMPS